MQSPITASGELVFEDNKRWRSGPVYAAGRRVDRESSWLLLVRARSAVRPEGVDLSWIRHVGLNTESFDAWLVRGLYSMGSGLVCAIQLTVMTLLPCETAKSGMSVLDLVHSFPLDKHFLMMFIVYEWSISWINKSCIVLY